jgi:hypothetical protein
LDAHKRAFKPVLDELFSRNNHVDNDVVNCYLTTVISINLRQGIDTDYQNNVNNSLFEKSELIVSTFNLEGKNPAVRIIGIDHCIDVKENLEKFPLDPPEDLLLLRKRFENPKGFFDKTLDISKIVPDSCPEIYQEPILLGGVKEHSNFELATDIVAAQGLLDTNLSLEVLKNFKKQACYNEYLTFLAADYYLGLSMGLSLYASLYINIREIGGLNIFIDHVVYKIQTKDFSCLDFIEKFGDKPEIPKKVPDALWSTGVFHYKFILVGTLGLIALGATINKISSFFI